MGQRLVKATQGVEDIRSLDDGMPFGRVCKPMIGQCGEVSCVGSEFYLTGERLYCDGGGRVQLDGCASLFTHKGTQYGTERFGEGFG